MDQSKATLAVSYASGVQRIKRLVCPYKGTTLAKQHSEMERIMDWMGKEQEANAGMEEKSRLTYSKISMWKWILNGVCRNKGSGTRIELELRSFGRKGIGIFADHGE
jgi:hypothetical protein